MSVRESWERELCKSGQLLFESGMLINKLIDQYERASVSTCRRRDGSARNRIEGAGSKEDPTGH